MYRLSIIVKRDGFRNDDFPGPMNARTSADFNREVAGRPCGVTRPPKTERARIFEFGPGQYRQGGISGWPESDLSLSTWHNSIRFLTFYFCPAPDHDRFPVRASNNIASLPPTSDQKAAQTDRA